jgi:hypothetical protein
MRFSAVGWLPSDGVAYVGYWELARHSLLEYLMGIASVMGICVHSLL